MQIRAQLAALTLSMTTKDRPLDAHIGATTAGIADFNWRRDRRRAHGPHDNPRTYIPLDVEDVA